MNGIDNPIVYYPSAILMIIFLFLAIKFKNIFYSLLSAIVVFFFAGFFFYVLGSEYNAVIQIAIYGIAVPIILGLAIMFTNLSRNNNEKNLKVSDFKYVIFITSGVFVLALIYLILTSLVVNPIGFNIGEVMDNSATQVINTFSQGIFVKYVWSFELVSLILTIVVVGLALIGRMEEE